MYYFFTFLCNFLPSYVLLFYLPVYFFSFLCTFYLPMYYFFTFLCNFLPSNVLPFFTFQCTTFLQGYIAHLLMAHLLIRSFRSNQMSDCKQFAQIAQDKWATLSESLGSLRGNERSWAKRSGPSRQMSDREWFTQVAQKKWVNEQFTQNMLSKKI